MGSTNAQAHQLPPGLQTGEAGTGRRARRGRGAPTDPQKWTPREDKEAERGRGPGRGLRGGHSKCKGPGAGGAATGVGRAGQSHSLESYGLPLPPWADTRCLQGGKRESPAHRQPLPEPAPSPTTSVPRGSPSWTLGALSRPCGILLGESRPCLRERGRKASQGAGGGRQAPSRSRSLQPSWGSLP